MLEMLFTESWQHPDIASIVKDNMDEDQINAECEVWTGPWLRLSMANGESAVAWFPDKNDYEAHLDKCYEKLNESYNEEESGRFTYKMITALYQNMKEQGIPLVQIVDISPDLGLYVSDGKWGFDT